jgi:hypothetical protein
MKKFTTMKAKHFLAAMLAIFMVVSAYAQDIPGTKAPAHPNILTPSLAYVVTTDNENNANTGTPDQDMDAYLFNYDAITPIEFNIFISETVITSAQLSILAYDVDWAGAPPVLGERDQVFVNGNYVGDLTGTNNTWSTSVFNFNPAWIVPGPSGKNLIRIDVDVTYPPPNSNWAVEVDWGQLIINGSTGTALFRYVNLDKPQYCGGQCPIVTEEVDATPDMVVRVETKLLDPANNALFQDTRTFTATSGDEPFTITTFCIPANPTPGTWKVQAICYENATNIQQDIRTVEFTVTESCTQIPTLTEWGLIILGFALLGVGTLYILRRRGSA